MKKIILILSILTVVTVKPAHALLLFTDESLFLSSAPIIFTDDFDELGRTHFPSGEVLRNHILYQETDKFANGWTISPGGSFAISQPNIFGSNGIGTDIIGFGRNRYADALGFWFISGAGIINSQPHNWQFIVHEVGGLQTQVDFAQMVSPYQSYYGFLSNVGIEKIQVRNNPIQSRRSNWEYDNVSYSQILGEGPLQAIPEPSTFFLVGAGILGFCSKRKKLMKKERKG